MLLRLNINFAKAVRASRPQYSFSTYHQNSTEITAIITRTLRDDCDDRRMR